MYKKIIFVFISVFVLTGCSDKYFVCETNIENTDLNYTLTAKYKIYYNKNYVTKIEKKEKYNSNDKNIINYFNDYKNLELNNLNDLYGGFDYEIKVDNKNVIIKNNIDLKITNIKKMVKDNYLNEYYVVNNKLTTTGAKYYYKERGAVCDE